MPELPEVETVVRSLRPVIVGQRIEAARALERRVLKGGRIDGAAGRLVEAVERRGKHIVIRLDRGLLLVHLGMTGRLLWNAPETPHTRAVFTLERGNLVYEDIRMFGRLEFSEDLPARVARLGPEPLEVTPEDFRARLAGRRSRIKAVLLDQGFLRGIGNIYADEALFRAGIHPKAIAARLGRARAGRLCDSVRAVLAEAIEHRGSSISDYVDADGNRGGFQLLHAVYGREGEPCTVCGMPVRRIVLAQRGTHYCPRCQRI